jgi:hypothetical protein
MALTAERYTQVKAELERMESRLFELSAEIDESAPVTDKKGFIYQAACRAVMQWHICGICSRRNKNTNAWRRKSSVGCMGNLRNKMGFTSSKTKIPSSLRTTQSR